MHEKEEFIVSFMRGKLPAYASYGITQDPLLGYRDENTKARYTVTIYIDLEKMKRAPRPPKRQLINCDRLFNDMRVLCKKHMPKLFCTFTIKRF